MAMLRVVLVGLFLTYTTSSKTVWETKNEPMLIFLDTSSPLINQYLKLINNERRYVPSTNMFKIEWSSKLENQTRRMLQRKLHDYHGCNHSIIDHCQKDDEYENILSGRLQLCDQNDPTRVFHLKTRNPESLAERIDRRVGFVKDMFAFRNVSNKKCGKYYQFYDESEKECSKNAYLLYKFTHLVACVEALCSQQLPNGFLVRNHIACMFEPEYSIPRWYDNWSQRSTSADRDLHPNEREVYSEPDEPQSSEKPKLFNPTTPQLSVCSQCDVRFRSCVESLCSSGTAFVLSIYCMLIMLFATV